MATSAMESTTPLEQKDQSVTNDKNQNVNKFTQDLQKNSADSSTWNKEAGDKTETSLDTGGKSNLYQDDTNIFTATSTTSGTDSTAGSGTANGGINKEIEAADLVVHDTMKMLADVQTLLGSDFHSDASGSQNNSDLYSSAFKLASAAMDFTGSVLDDLASKLPKGDVPGETAGGGGGGTNTPGSSEGGSGGSSSGHGSSDGSSGDHASQGHGCHHGSGGGHGTSSGDSSGSEGDSDKPSGGSDKPSGGSEQPSGGSDKPSGGSDKPSGGSEQPSGGSDKPSGGSEQPSGGSDKPSGGSEQPSGGSDKPSGGSEQPSGGSDKPSGGSEQPSGGSDKPSGGSDKPTTGSDKPATGSDKPATGSDKPTSSADQPPKVTDATAGEWKNESINGMQYRVLLPANYDPQYKYPVLLYEHQLDMGNYEQGLMDEVNPWFNDPQFRSEHPAIVVMPLLDQSADPSGQTVNYGGVSGEQQAGQVNAVAAVKQVMSEYSADPSRVYMTGNSLGGIGTWDTMIKYNAYTGTEGKIFAAGMPLAGATYNHGNPPDQSVVDAMRNVPMWAIHGSQDGQVPLDWDRQMAQALSGSDTFHYTEVAGDGHDVWDDHYPYAQGKEYWDWLFSQSV